MKCLRMFVCSLVLLMVVPIARATTEIVFWHSMTGELRTQVEQLAARFNAIQAEEKRSRADVLQPGLGNARVYWSRTDYRVVPVYKGRYDEALAALQEAVKAGTPPHIVQVFDVGTADMMAASDTAGGGVVKPVYEVMAIGGEMVSPQTYLPAVASYYTDIDGRLLSLPFNSSTPALYINKAAFREAGLDPARPPRTWAEMAVAAARLKAAGAQCIYTTGWQSWIHMENLGALHDRPFASAGNGFEAGQTRLLFDAPLYVKHIGMLADWVDKGWFTPIGHRNEAEPLFFRGKCAMLTSSSAAYGDIARNAHFEFAISPLPYHDEVKGAPQNTLIGGASLWVMAGKTLDEYKGVARFLNFLSQREVQAEWHQNTGYLPISATAYALTREQGFYDNHPGLDAPLQAMIDKPQTANSKGIRLRHFARIRAVIDEELDAVWAGKKTAAGALAAAVARGNRLLEH